MTTLHVDALADDPALLKRLLQDLAAERAKAILERDAAVLECGLANKKLDEVLTEVAQLTSERDALRHKLNLRIREIYGPSSEKLTDKQLHLFLSRVEQIQEEAAKQKQQDDLDAQGVKVGAHTRVKRVIKPFPADLPHKEVVIDVPDEQKLCPCCNKPRVEVHCHEREVIEITPHRSPWSRTSGPCISVCAVPIAKRSRHLHPSSRWARPVRAPACLR